MSTLQLAVNRTFQSFHPVRLAEVSARFWRWWISLYADAPRRLPPTIL